VLLDSSRKVGKIRNVSARGVVLEGGRLEDVGRSRDQVAQLGLVLAQGAEDHARVAHEARDGALLGVEDGQEVLAVAGEPGERAGT